MKIELKAIKFSEAMSEETNAFTAKLYINGKNIGYCKNTGQGGCTDYNANSPALRGVIAEAEAYCKTLPKYQWGELEFDQSLETVINQILEDWLKAKQTKKLERLMNKGILIGVPESTEYGYYNFKKSLSEVPQPHLQASIVRIKSNLNTGEIILNTNLEALGIKV